MYHGGSLYVVKKYVYSHPVNVFIIGRLGLSVEVFCELYGFKQGTLSSWVTREKTVASLPIEFLHGLVLSFWGDYGSGRFCLQSFKSTIK